MYSTGGDDLSECDSTSLKLGVFLASSAVINLLVFIVIFGNA